MTKSRDYSIDPPATTRSGHVSDPFADRAGGLQWGGGKAFCVALRGCVDQGGGGDAWGWHIDPVVGCWPPVVGCWLLVVYGAGEQCQWRHTMLSVLLNDELA